VAREVAQQVRGEIAQALDGAALATRIHLHIAKN